MFNFTNLTNLATLYQTSETLILYFFFILRENYVFVKITVAALMQL